MLTRQNNPTQAYLQQWVALTDGRLVVKYSLCLSALTSYVVYEPSLWGPHSSITFEQGRCYGDLTTRRLPPELDSLPVGSARSQAVRAYHQTLEEEAEALIALAFPDDFPERAEQAQKDRGC